MIKIIEKFPVTTITGIVLLMLLVHLDVLNVTIMEARNFITARYRQLVANNFKWGATLSKTSFTNLANSYFRIVIWCKQPLCFAVTCCFNGTIFRYLYLFFIFKIRTSKKAKFTQQFAISNFILYYCHYK